MRGRFSGGLLAEQLREFFGHGSAKLLGVHNGDRAAVIARHVMADADGDKFDRGFRFNVEDDLAQMPFQIIAGVDR